MPGDSERRAEAFDEEGSSRPVQKKGKKKGRKGTLLFLFLLLGAGVAAGLHAAGRWDARPIMYEAVPRIPWVGKRLAAAVGIPAEYSLTAEQRRRIELQRWNDRLNEREREIERRESSLAGLSADLEKRAAAVKKAEDAQTAALAGVPEKPEEEKEYLDMLMKTFQDICPDGRPHYGALREDLAVKLLERMPQDARASILGRMEAAMAARLTAACGPGPR